MFQPENNINIPELPKYFTLDLSLKRGPVSKRRVSRKWTAADDKVLMEAITTEAGGVAGVKDLLFRRAKHSFWLNVANAVNSKIKSARKKTPDSCRTRWKDHLQFAKRSDCVTEKELYLILLAVTKMKGDCLNDANRYATGTSLPVITWKKLSLIFPGRSELDIKNAYHSFQRHKFLKSNNWEIVLEDSNPKPLVENNAPDYQFWQKGDDELWTIMQNLMKKNDDLQESYNTRKRSFQNEVEQDQIRSELTKKRRREVLLMNVASDALESFRKEEMNSNIDESLSTVNPNEIDVDELIGVQPLSKLREYARGLGIKLTGRTKAAVVKELCVAIYQNSELLDDVIKALNDSSNANGHTFTVIDGDQSI